MWPNFTNALAGWQSVLWLALAAVPPLIILLYFLKLKRHPLEVPSTYLWHKSIEDLHVNSIWQRLRRNLLLFLQLLLIFLAMLALLRPNWKGGQLTGDRFIFLIDTSASMQAKDRQPSRLEEARRKVGEMIDKMKSGDVAMIVSFADTARVEQSFTDNRRQLRRALAGIRPTQQSTSLLEALRVASGLANPGHIAEDPGDLQVAEALPARLFIFSDGKFAPVTGFSLGNLDPVFVPIGEPTAANVGITAFGVRRNEAKPELFQAFARLENCGEEPVEVSIELSLDGRLIDADRLEIPADEARGVAFDLGAVEAGVLKLKVASGDDLALDDVAWAVVSPPRRAGVLLVTPGNEPLEMAFQTDSARQLTNLAVESPEFLKKKPYRDAAAAAVYDVVIYDRCRPEEMPRANTLFLGTLPPQAGWSAGAQVDTPQIIDTEAAHPLLQWIDLGDVLLLEGTPLKPPQAGSVLVDSDAGPMMAIAPREEFEDVVLGFRLIDEVADEQGRLQRYIGTNWMSRQSFPVFALNVLDYLGGSRGLLGSGSVRLGEPVIFEGPSPQAKPKIRLPSGEVTAPKKGASGKFSFAGTEKLGVYEVSVDKKPFRQFAVNLFDRAESNIRPNPKPSIQIGYVEVAGQSSWEAARRETWKWLLLLGLAVLLLEWYIYNRRVYL